MAGPRVIAIDGPAGAGKSTIAKLVAMATGLPYLDTGAMYRCIAHACLRDGVDPSSAQEVGRLARQSRIVVDGARVEVDGEDVSHVVRTSSVGAVVSVIAAHSPVRDALRGQQRDWIEGHGGGVVEGRDIGTVVFPDAVLKVFLTASPEVRAARRVSQVGGDIAEIARGISQRDLLDSTREDSPLRPAADSHTVDSSDKSIDEVVAEIVELYESKIGKVA